MTYTLEIIRREWYSYDPEKYIEHKWTLGLPFPPTPGMSIWPPQPDSGEFVDNQETLNNLSWDCDEGKFIDIAEWYAEADDDEPDQWEWSIEYFKQQGGEVTVHLPPEQ